MKFNDGFWLLKHGVKPYYGLQVVHATVEREAESGAVALHLQVATRPIKHRGDTIGGPLLSVRVYSPTEGVVGVRIAHFKHADPNPEIPLFPDAPAIHNVQLTTTPEPDIPSHSHSRTHIVVSDNLTAEITTLPYTITFKTKSTGKVLTFAGYKHQAMFDVPYQWTTSSATNTTCLTNDPSSNPGRDLHPSSVRYINSELNISPGEVFWGFGEQFGTFAKNGQAISIWNQDGGTSSEQAYKCVPFYLSSRGYGVFINHPGEVEVEVGSEKISRVCASVADEELEYFVIHGDSPLQILERYTRMTGRPALPPLWTFGLWLSTSFLTDYDAKTVEGFLEGMRRRRCHVRVFHFDCFWMKQYEWCSFTFDPHNFPDPKAYLADIKAKYGVKVCIWINPYISQMSPVFAEAVKGGYLIKRTDGTPWQWDLWQPGLGILDITNPEACGWYASKLKALLDLGVDCFKTDFGERIPHASVQFHDGSDPVRMHNLYSVLYNELVFNILKERFGEGEAVVFARSGSVGSQRFPVHWGGDCESTFEAMAEAMRGCLSLTSSGFAFSSHDIGGFEGHPPPDVYHRWVAFGLFSTHSRLHGSASYRVPWIYGEDAAQNLAIFLETKHRLMPYLYYYAIEAHLKGHPLMRAMPIEFVSDRTTHHLDQQFMLGPSLLVAPVFVPEGEETEYYLPAGRWTSFFDTKRVIEGPRWIREKVPLNEIPLWVREGSVLVLGPEGVETPDYELSKDVEVRVYELAEGQRVEVGVPSGGGKEVAGMVTVERKGEGLRVSVPEGAVGVAKVKFFVQGCSLEGGGDGGAVVLNDGTREITLKVVKSVSN